MKKRILSLCMAAVLLLGLTGCDVESLLSGAGLEIENPLEQIENPFENVDLGGMLDMGQKAPAVENVPDATVPTTEATEPPTTVPEPVITYEYRYEVVKGDVTWSQADAACRQRGGYLATINTPEEYREISRLAEQSGLRYVWLGARLSYNSTQWVWSDGEEISMDSPYWCRTGSIYEPSYYDKSDGVREDCLCLWDYSANGYSWTLNDQRDNLVADFPSTSGLVGYICEYKVEVIR